jgi:xylulokinase
MEQDMVVSASAGVNAIRTLMQQPAARGIEIAGIGTSGWMHGDVLLGNRCFAPDLSVGPLANASMWNCDRSLPQYEAIMKYPALQRLFIESTGNVPAMRFTIVKALHRKTETPDLWAATQHVVTPTAWWNYFLTGILAQEKSDVIGAVNVAGNGYANDVFQSLALENKFAPLIDSTDQVGTLRREIAQATGLPEGIPVFGGGGDQQCGRIGNGVVTPGIVGFNLGTSGVTTTYNPDKILDPNGFIHYFPQTSDAWFMMCSMASGDSFNWLKSLYGEVNTALDFNDITDLASRSKPGANGLVFLPALSEAGGNHPVRAPQATGTLFGLKTYHTARDVARAVMEGVAIEMVICAKMMADLGIDIQEARLAGGGARDISGTWPRIFADALGKRVTLNMEADASGLGAGIIAMVGAGIKPTFADSGMFEFGQSFEPNPDNFEVYRALEEQYLAHFGVQ